MGKILNNYFVNGLLNTDNLNPKLMERYIKPPDYAGSVHGETPKLTLWHSTKEWKSGFMCGAMMAANTPNSHRVVLPMFENLSETLSKARHKVGMEVYGFIRKHGIKELEDRMRRVKDPKPPTAPGGKVEWAEAYMRRRTVKSGPTDLVADGRAMYLSPKSVRSKDNLLLLQHFKLDKALRSILIKDAIGAELSKGSFPTLFSDMMTWQGLMVECFAYLDLLEEGGTLVAAHKQWKKANCDHEVEYWHDGEQELDMPVEAIMKALVISLIHAWMFGDDPTFKEDTICPYDNFGKLSDFRYPVNHWDRTMQAWNALFRRGEVFSLANAQKRNEESSTNGLHSLP